MSQRVLVTGGSGFIAGHCILHLLEQGHEVRTTIRSLGREPDVRAVLADAGMADDAALSFVAADLLADDGWPEAVAGLDAVLHVASPVQPGPVDNPDDLIVPAVEGTLRVLRAACDAGADRLVLTSAFHAVSWGHPHDDHVFTEADWTVLDGPGVDAYGQSKTLAERAAWDFVAAEGASLDLVTLLPVAVMGPVMGHSVSGANHIVQRMLDGEVPGYPDIFFPIVDVRDVAVAHSLALSTGAAAGERFLLSNGPVMAMKDIGALLRSSLGAAASRVPTQTIPDEIIRAGAADSEQLRAIAQDLGYQKQTSNEKARTVLSWEPRAAADAVVAAGQSLVAKGLVRS